MTYSATPGFSAVELMISMFIAVAFIASGYQLYSVIIKDGSEVNYRTQASNIAYSYLRQYGTQPSGNCVAKSTQTITMTASEKATLPNNAKAYYDYTCPYGTGSSVWRITTKVTYGTPTQEIAHALFISQ